MLKAVLFDLDGTLLPMNEEEFIKLYFGALCKKVAPFSYDSEEFISVIWAGTKAMAKNDGSKTNEEAFWETFANHYGKEKLADKQYFDDFYLNEFRCVKSCTKDNPYLQDILGLIKKLNLRVILATNPLFPKEGTYTRMGFLGLKPEDFEYVSTYENSHFAKPNPQYFVEILNKHGLKPDEVIYFGNSESEDLIPASSLGIKTYLVGDFITHAKENSQNPPHYPLSEITTLITKYHYAS